jgi:hypothetical protein
LFSFLAQQCDQGIPQRHHAPIAPNFQARQHLQIIRLPIHIIGSGDRLWGQTMAHQPSRSRTDLLEFLHERRHRLGLAEFAVSTALLGHMNEPRDIIRPHPIEGLGHRVSRNTPAAIESPNRINLIGMGFDTKTLGDSGTSNNRPNSHSSELWDTSPLTAQKFRFQIPATGVAGNQ